MFVRLWMSDEPVTLGPDAPIMDARDLMEGMGFRRIPVVEEGKLVGHRDRGACSNDCPRATSACRSVRFMQENPVTIDPYRAAGRRGAADEAATRSARCPSSRRASSSGS
jgi:predicted transcriptional regulator